MSPELITRIIDLDRAGVTLREQAAVLGMTEARVSHARRKLIALGAIRPRLSYPQRRFWTRREQATLETMIDAGYGYAAIARRLKRSECSIRLRCKQHRLSVLRGDATLSAAGFARLIGVLEGRVSYWIAQGIVPARDAGSGVNRLWRITWEDALAWVEARANWPRYDVTRVPDPALREHLTELQANAGGAWLDVPTIARRYHVGVHAVRRWLRLGILPHTQVGNAWYVWSGDLDGFVIPSERR